MATKTIDLAAKADELVRMAAEAGVEKNYFFSTTFHRYQMLLHVMSALEKTIMENDTLVNKEYVKGRENVQVHPAIREYNKTVATANATITTLLSIITTLSKHSIAEGMETDEEL